MLWPLIILAVLLVLNGVFAMSELAVMTSRRSRLERAAKRGRAGAAAALALARNPTRFLSTVQVGITLIAILAGAIGQRALSAELSVLFARWPALASYADVIALTVVVLVLTYCSVVFGELVPKRLAVAFPEPVAMVLARPLRVMSMIAAPVVALLSGSTDLVLRLLRVPRHVDEDISEEDVRAIVARAASAGVFEPAERRLFDRMFTVGDLRVSALMIPRPEVAWIDIDASHEEILRAVAKSPHARLPVCDKSLDSPLGMLHVKDFIAKRILADNPPSLRAILEQPVFAPETMTALRAIELFRARATHNAFVVDEHGGVEGLVTLDDVVEAVLGRLPSRGEESPTAFRRGDGSWLLDGSLGVHEMVRALELPEEAERDLRANTVGGVVVMLLGHVPEAGESVQWQGVNLEVVDMDGRRVDKVLATHIAPEPGDHA